MDATATRGEGLLCVWLHSEDLHAQISYFRKRQTNGKSWSSEISVNNTALATFLFYVTVNKSRFHSKLVYFWPLWKKMKARWWILCCEWTSLKVTDKQRDVNNTTGLENKYAETRVQRSQGLRPDLTSCARRPLITQTVSKLCLH